MSKILRLIGILLVMLFVTAIIGRNHGDESWYIILVDGKRIGNIYLARDNSWGYFIMKEEQRKGYGTQAMQELVRINPRKYYISNINPDNIGAVHMARDRLKGELVKQVSYRIARDNVLNCQL